MAQAQSHSPDNILILGDFNAGNIYLDSKFTAHSPITPLEVNLHDEFLTLNLKQLINEPTRYTVAGGVANLRDIIAVSNNDMICDSGILPPFSNIDHLPVFATLKINSPSISRQSVQLWDYGHTDTHKLTRLLIDTNWDRLFDCDVDEATDNLPTP